MGTTTRAWAVLALLAAFACSKSSGPPGPPDAARPKIVRPRPPPASGELPVDIGASKLSLTIIKDRDTKSPVLATLLLRDGAVALAAPGKARLSIDLDTFDSGIPVRNERVRGIFFETAALGWDSAELTIDALPEAALTSLHDTKAAHATLAADLKVHGRSAKLDLPVDAGYTDAGVLWVKSSEPIEVKISDFGLAANLKRLSALCMHDSIDDVVKVDVSLVFPAR